MGPRARKGVVAISSASVIPPNTPGRAVTPFVFLETSRKQDAACAGENEWRLPRSMSPRFTGPLRFFAFRQGRQPRAKSVSQGKRMAKLPIQLHARRMSSKCRFSGEGSVYRKYWLSAARVAADPGTYQGRALPTELHGRETSLLTCSALRAQVIEKICLFLIQGLPGSNYSSGEPATMGFTVRERSHVSAGNEYPASRRSPSSPALFRNTWGLANGENSRECA
jgi:hypothetical protein